MIRISDEIRALFPDLVVGFLSGSVINSEQNSELWELISMEADRISRTMDAEAIRQVEAIRLGKQAYRHLGKDPNRYRLSAEALMRRMIKNQDLYAINTVVDVLNLVSIKTGVTIGGFDNRLINGPIELGKGSAEDPFEAIGRGALNVENLPVYRDLTGVIGNPTSDCTRTRITLKTNEILMLITGFYGKKTIESPLNELEKMLEHFCQGGPFTKAIISA